MGRGLPTRNLVVFIRPRMCALNDGELIGALDTTLNREGIRI